MTRAKIKLLLLAAVFAAPLVAAMLAYFVFPDAFPGGRLNYGTLIEPARPLPDLPWLDATGASRPAVFRGKWSVTYVGGAECADSCRERLLLTRQVRLALSDKRARVQRVYIAPDLAAAAALETALRADHPDLVMLVADANRVRDFFQPREAGELFLVDPLGNWLMVYRGAIEHKGLHRDLKKLLRFSQIG